MIILPLGADGSLFWSPLTLAATQLSMEMHPDFFNHVSGDAAEHFEGDIDALCKTDLSRGH